MNDKLQQLEEKKKELDSLKPLAKEVFKALEDWLRVELTYSSNAIEGNTLTRLETAEVIERGVSAVIPGKPLKDQLEALNHAKALEYIKKLSKEFKSHQFIIEEHIKSIHKIILEGIDDNWAGKYRQTMVYIKGTDLELPSPHKIPYLMNEFIQWLSQQQEQNPVKVAALSHLKFVTIHPFIDGNGRVGRLLMNLVLLINGYPMAIIRNEERAEYLNSLNIAQTKNNLEPFYNFIAVSVERSLDAYINAAKGKPVIPTLTEGTTPKESKLLKIGDLAKATGETVHTIRFWTKEKLLEVKDYTKGGYQLYDISMIDRAKEIRRLQNQRFTLSEIKKELV